MSQFALDIEKCLHEIVLSSENQLEILVGSCQSTVKLTNTQEHILMLIEKAAYTNTEIAKQLNERGVKTKKGGEWQAKQILGIARNGFYTGRLSWQGIVNTGTHEAIVSERQFNRVQRILDANK